MIYDLLFKAAAETTLTIAADPKQLGASIGIIAVLHTWGSALTPPSARAHDRARWRLFAGCDRSGSPADRAIFCRSRSSRRCSAGYFWRCWSRRTLPTLQFFGDHVRLTDKAAFDAYLKPLRKIDWVVYAKEPFAGPKQVLRYLSRYTHRVAISNRRLVSADENGVTFKYKDYRIDGPGRYKTMTLATDEFIRRFLIHVLPKRFHRIRHYGLLASGNRAANIARARQLLATPSRPKQPEPSEAAAARRAAHAAVSMSLLRWPHDHHRDLRTRLSAKTPPHTRTANDQDRYLMTPSPPFDGPY